MLSFTSDKEVAVLFNKQRRSIGEELIDKKLDGSKAIQTNLEYPHNGSKMEGAGYKAKSMEDKWDIYFWNGIIYLTRSWTGEIIYKAYTTVAETNFTITKIEYSENEYTLADQSLVIDNVHFILISHAFGRPFPNRVPKTLITDKEIALYSFNQFGHNCWYATYDTILDTVVIPKCLERNRSCAATPPSPPCARESKRVRCCISPRTAGFRRKRRWPRRSSWRTATN